MDFIPGLFTSKINTGILNHATVFTTPAPAASVATGTHTLTPANLANGFVIVTANATSTAVTMPSKANFITLFGASRVVGDTFIWYLHNAGTTVNEDLTLTAATGATFVGHVEVASNSADNATATTGGTSTGCFMTRLTNVDGSTITYRLSQGEYRKCQKT